MRLIKHSKYIRRNIHVFLIKMIENAFVWF